MVKDRAKPFSKKHRKYWIPVTGGMILIGVLNIAIGFCSYEPPSDHHERIQVTIPKSDFHVRSSVNEPLLLDAGVDATAR